MVWRFRWAVGWECDRIYPSSAIVASQSRMRTLLRFSVLLIMGAGLANGEAVRCPAHVTKMTMEKGEYSPQEGATFNLENFSATMVARGKASPLCFQRETHIHQGKVWISAESLTTMFSQKLHQSTSKISEIKVEMKDNAAHLSGKVHKGINIPFEIEGPVSTDGTVLILETKKIKTEGLPVKGLLGMIGKDLGSILKSESANGVSAKGDALIFEPAKIAHVHGKMTGAEITPKGLMLTFSGESAKQQH
jgi:hypothetical protein